MTSIKSYGKEKRNLKNIYFVQPSSYYGNEICLPYAVGAIAAYAWSIDEVKRNYSQAGIFYKNTEVEECIDDFTDPFLVAFSCYVWNFEYNKILAKRIKQKYPDCYILFGGHNVSNNSSELLEECDFIDFLIHEEGEVPFAELLVSLSGEKDFSKVPNLSYRDNGLILKNENMCFEIKEFPSPYTEGVFDNIFDSSSDVFYGIIETNRGCPYNCVYCDWGRQSKNVRVFPLEKVKKDIEWLAEHKIGYCICADANFGILDRDVMISEWFVESKRKTGYPSKIQFCFTKNSDERVYQINKAMNEVGLSKGATISLQTLSEDSLKDIGRINMSFEDYTSLVRKYNQAGILTYTDMILGLPGETFESFTKGIGKLFEAGQHSNVNVFNCEMLINARLNEDEFKKNHKIRIAKCSLNRHHSELGQEIEENNLVVIATKDMDENKWIDANVFVAVTGAFHNLAILQLFAIYLYNEMNVAYADFYLSFIDYFSQNESSVIGRIICELKSKLADVVNGKGSCETFIEDFGNVNWPVEEWFFLQVIREFDLFFEEVVPFLERFNIDKSIFENLIMYQKSIVKRPDIRGCSFEISYDFPEYFYKINNGKKERLKKRNLIVKISDDNYKDNYKDYARETVWYGRKGGRIMYREEMHVLERT